MSVGIQFMAENVVGMFTSDHAVVAQGAQYIRGYIWDCIFAGIHFSFSGYFCAYGRSELSFLHNITAIVLVRGDVSDNPVSDGTGDSLWLSRLRCDLSVCIQVAEKEGNGSGAMKMNKRKLL